MLSLIDRLIPDIDCAGVMPILPGNEDEITGKYIERFSPVIMIYRSQTPVSSLRRFQDQCSRTHSTRPGSIRGYQRHCNGAEEMMMVVVTDPEGTDSSESGGSPLVTLTAAELDVICPSDRGDLSAAMTMARKVTRMREILQLPAENSQGLFQRQINKFIIGIFSREAESQYSWLVTALTSDVSSGRGPEIRTCSISNSGFQQFCDVVSQCKFGILYHSKNRGRINVTDVTDSLYDEELEHLHSKLGRKSVFVVIDDLDDSGDHQKMQIQKNQPSIGEKAEDLFLISNKEKMSNYRSRLMVDRGRAEKKLQKLKGEIKKRKKN